MHHSHAKSPSCSDSFHMHSTAPLSDLLSSSSSSGKNAPSPLQRRPPRPTLRKQASLADFGATIKARFLRKLVPKDDEDLDWGCAGEQASTTAPTTMGAPSTLGPASSLRLMSAFDAEPAPPRRPPPVDVSLSCWTKDQIRNAERRQEERMAQDALASYFARQAMMDKDSGPPPAAQNKGKDGVAVAVKRYDHARSTSKSSTTSSHMLSGSSRRLTNESLPSYSSCAGTPEVELGPTPLHRRPSLTPAPAYYSHGSDVSDKATSQPRSYGFF
ncbi:hypothetical protein OIV83_006264 [Microbotryomycetes sp. JL201]|nr:hypothetical protein OIV83_006264 [Microbotryomycetes sp. JL201]